MRERLPELRALAELLERNHYRALIQILTNGRIHHTPWAQCSQKRLAALPPASAELVRLFHLGATIERPRWLATDVIDRLVEIGLIIRTGTALSLRDFAILPYEGLLLIAQRWQPGSPTTEHHLWLGNDTTFVSRSVSSLRGQRVLEVCAGIGTHALLMASRGCEVWGVDLNPTAVKVATWNAWLNGLQDVTHFSHGDLYAPVQHQRFDYVVSSPPFLPYPEDGTTPLLFATAGSDGLAVLLRILDGLSDALAPRGRALFLAAGFGDANGPGIATFLERLAADKRWRVDLILIGDGPARNEMSRLGRELPSVARELEELGAARQADERYCSFLIAIEQDDSGSGAFTVIDGRSSWSDGIEQLRAAGPAELRASTW